jgi:hypothetical protein
MTDETQNTISGTALSLIKNNTVMLGDGEYEIERRVTRTVISQKDGEPLFVLFQEPAYTSDVKQKKGNKDMDPARCANVINLETGEEHILIMNTVLESELNKAYPDNGYVGRAYAITRSTPEQGEGDRRYKVYKIIELRKKKTEPNQIASSKKKSTHD